MDLTILFKVSIQLNSFCYSIAFLVVCIYDFDANFKYSDVSSNGLKGAIPSSIGRLSHLQVL
jgi:hypothetical protein